MRSVMLPLTFIAASLLPLTAFAQKADVKKTDETTAAEAASDAKKESSTSAATSTEPPPEQWDITDVEEQRGKTYMFVGLRYRGDLVPAFLLNLFVDQGKSIYTNMVGVEFDIRKDGFSIIPALTFHELGTGDILFKQKNTPDIPGNYSLVNSGLKVVYASVDLLWSSKVHKNIEIEYGAGFGIGAVFGDLETSWVRPDPAGKLTAGSGTHYTRCETATAGPGCSRADHQNSSIEKVNGYKEPSWFSGGSKPALFPWIAVPQLGLRFKPIKNFVGRLGVGFALTGFWFGLSAQYGLEQKRD